MNATHVSRAVRNAFAASSKIAAFLGTAALISLSGLNAAQAQAIGERNGNLTTADGRTLYSFDNDAAAKSNCNNACAAAWPPFLAKEGAKDKDAFTVIRRDDGSAQWAMSGKPLYFFAGDTTPGEAKGDGMGGVWHVLSAANRVPAKASTSSYGSADSHGYSYKY